MTDYFDEAQIDAIREAAFFDANDEAEALGLTDLPARALKGQPFTYWDYRAGMFHKGMGMRIDLVLASTPVAAAVKDAYIDREARKGKGPSDHAPVVVDLDLPAAG